MARRFARRLLVVPPGLDTRVPVAEPLVPLGASVVAVLPEHVSGASPGSRPSSLDRSLSSYLGRLVGSPVPDPLAVFGVHAWWSCPGIKIKRIRGIPQFRGGFPQRLGPASTGPSTGGPELVTESGARWPDGWVR